MGAILKTGICTYCEKERKITRDHIPPKGIYPKPRPDCMTWVPACEKCNGDASKDDEYFRLVVAARGEANKNNAAKKTMQPVIRSLGKANAKGYSRRIYSSIDSRNVISRGGIFLQDQIVMDADLDRLLSVVSRTTYGLHVLDFGEKVPDDCEIESFPLNQASIDADNSVEQLVAHAAGTEPHVIDEDVFTYWKIHPDECVNMSFWVYEFYKTACFASLVRPKTVAE